MTTPSEYTRRLLIDRLDLDEAKAIVVPAPLFPRETATEAAGGSDAFDIEGPFFLYAAITHPHKNHVVLLRAFARVARSHPSVSLVLTGARGAAEDATLAEVSRLGLQDRVHRLGRIPRADLDRLFRRSIALTFPSRHEGYGLPVAEAMVLGCPIIASNATALPEVAGNAGILLDPDDVDGWADAMERVRDDEGFRSTLIAAGRERARALSPANTASRLVGAYRLALGSD